MSLMDDGSGSIIPFVIFAVIAAVCFVGWWYYEKKRREALIAFAKANGWTLSLEKRHGSPSFPSDIFDKGHSRWSRYHMAKRLDGAIPGGPDNGDADTQAFEYHYAQTSGSGKNRKTTHYYFTCLHFRVPVDLGRVTIKDEHFGHKLIQGIGFEDIDLEDPDFSSRFVVKAEDRKDAYDLLGPSLMRYMLDWENREIQTQGRDVLIHMKGRVDVKDVQRLERFVRGFLENLPRLLVNNARVEAGLEPLTEAGDVRAPSGTTHSENKA